MSKKILFVIPSLDAGGAEKSLASLLNVMDYSKYDVDLLLFKKKGAFLEIIPKEVKIISLDNHFANFNQPVLKSLFFYLVNLKIKCLIRRILFFFIVRFNSNPYRIEQKSWKHLSKCLNKLKTNYDVAIGYLEKSANYYVIEKVNASKKIGWIHSDLEQMDIDMDFENQKLYLLNNIIVVSDGLSSRLIKRFPNLKEKVKTIENIIDKKTIEKLAEESIKENFSNEFVNIVYIGRLSKEKGLVNAVLAINNLVKYGHAVKLFLIGNGNLKEELQKEANRNEIEEQIVFLGFKSNPYPYLKASDIFILPSFFEGKSIALEEAKLFNKLIVITDFSSAKDQIINNKTGLIAEMNPQSISDKIKMLIDDKELKNKLINNLKNQKTENSSEINKLYKLIEN